MLPRVGSLSLIVAGSALGLVACGGSDGVAAGTTSPAATRAAAVSPSTTAASTPPTGPWTETGPEKPVTQKALPSTTTFTVAGKPPLVVFGGNGTTLGEGSGADSVNSYPAGYTVVGAPVFDTEGTGMVALIGKPSTGDNDYGEAPLVSGTIDPTGQTSPLPRLSSHAQYPEFASDEAGNAIIAWVEDTQSAGLRSARRYSIKMRVRRSGQSFGPAKTVTTLPGGVGVGNYLPFGPQITVAIGHGKIVLATKDARTRQIGRSTIEAWTGTINGGLHARGISIVRSAVTITSAIGSTGRIFLAWGDQISGEEPDSPWIVSATSFPSAARKPGPVQQVDRGVKTFPIAPPRLVDDRRGGALLAWSGTRGAGFQGSSTKYPVRVAESRADGRFGATQTLAPTGAVDDLVVSGAGGAILTWANVHETGEPSGLVASVRPAVATQFAAPETVPVGSPTVIPKPAFDLDGRPTVAYATRSSSGEFLHLLTRTAP